MRRSTSGPDRARADEVVRGSRPRWQTGVVVYVFGDCRLDLRRYELQRGGEVRPIEPQVFDVLVLLVRERDRVVTKEELLDTVWGDRFVSESALTSRIKAARQAIGDDGKAQRLVRTVHGRGYQFVADVTELDEHPSPSSSTDPLPEQEIRFCTADDGTRLAYATMGSGRPLVKVANWLSHLDYDRQSVVWRHWLIELARRFRLVRYDERGCGLSDWDVPEFSFEAWVRDLEAVVDAVGLERFPLLGISQGGPVAIAYAVRNPERVSHLVLLGSYAQGRRARATTPEDHELVDARIQMTRVAWGGPTRSTGRCSCPASCPRARRRSGGSSTSSSSARRRPRTRGGSCGSSATSTSGTWRPAFGHRR